MAKGKKRPSLNQLVLQNIMELKKDKSFLEQIESRIEDRYIEKAFKKTT